MAASKEWTVWHLTPDGWVTGEKEWDSGSIKGQIPSDRVKTVLYIEICNGYSLPFGETREEWQHKDELLVKAALDKYGSAPARL